MPRRPRFSQQASVRRGPRASATSLFTVSLAESEASAFLPNRVCVSPIIVIIAYFQICLNVFVNGSRRSAVGSQQEWLSGRCAFSSQQEWLSGQQECAFRSLRFQQEWVSKNGCQVAALSAVSKNGYQVAALSAVSKNGCQVAALSAVSSQQRGLW